MLDGSVNILNPVGQCFSRYSVNKTNEKVEIDFLWIAFQSLRFNSTKLEQNDKCIDEPKMINLI